MHLRGFTLLTNYRNKQTILLFNIFSSLFDTLDTPLDLSKNQLLLCPSNQPSKALLSLRWKKIYYLSNFFLVALRYDRARPGEVGWRGGGLFAVDLCAGAISWRNRNRKPLDTFPRRPSKIYLHPTDRSKSGRN